MQPVFAVFAGLCVLAPPAAAKGRMTMSLGDSSPRVGQHITVVLRMRDVVSNRKPDVMVVAVAPGREWYEVVGTVTGASRLVHADIPRDGFRVDLGAPGFTAPAPIVRTVSLG